MEKRVQRQTLRNKESSHALPSVSIFRASLEETEDGLITSQMQ